MNLIDKWMYEEERWMDEIERNTRKMNEITEKYHRIIVSKYFMPLKLSNFYEN